MMATILVKKKRTTRIRPAPDPPPRPSADSARRSLRPRRSRPIGGGDYFDDDYEQDGEFESSKERGRLKLPPVPALHVSRSGYSPSSSVGSEDEMVKPPKKRRIDDSDGGSGHPQERGSGFVSRRSVHSFCGTRLPARTELEVVLGKLQKKDFYRVFARPVDPEELPDYHDLIEHPMDFATVRRKLNGGVYRSLEQFEDDVFLICNNAMQYNAPYTIYFRQAHSIQDMAKKKFQELRADVMSRGAAKKSEEKTSFYSMENKTLKKSSFYSMENKTLKKSQCRNIPEPLASGVSSMEKIIKKPHCRTAPHPLGSNISSMEKKILKKPQYKTSSKRIGSDISSLEDKKVKGVRERTLPLSFASDISSLENKKVKDVQRTFPQSFGFDISSLENKKVKDVRRTFPQSFGPDISSLENKKVKDVRGRTLPQSFGSEISILEKKAPKEPYSRTAPEPHVLDISLLEKKMLKKPQIRIPPEPLDSDISSLEKKTSKKAQCKTATEPRHSDTSFLEKKTFKKAQCTTEPLDSDISSLEKKTSSKTQCRSAPEPLGSDISSGATLASAADTCTDMSTLQALGLVSAAETCTGLSTLQSNDPSTTDTHAGLSSVEVDTVERSADGSSSLGESKSQKTDKIPAKILPSKLSPKPFVVDVNRQATYSTSDKQQMVEPDSLFDVFDGESRQLVAVGLESEFSYARSLARFSAFLGPIAWGIASKRINEALSPEVEFGRGWVGEYEPLLTPFLYVRENMNTQQQQVQQQHQKQQQLLLQQEQQQQRQLMQQLQVQPQQQSRTVSKKDKGAVMKSETTAVHLNQTSNGSKEETSRERTLDQKHGLFGIDLTQHSIITSPVPHHQKKQATDAFPKASTNEITAHRSQSSSETAKSKFPSIVSKNEVQGEQQKQQEAATQQRRNNPVGTNVAGLSAWKSSESNPAHTSFEIISNQQATSDPSRWVSSSGKNSNQVNIVKVSSNGFERSLPNTYHSPRPSNPSATIGAPKELKSVDKQVGSGSSSPTWKTPIPASRVVYEDSRVSEDSQVQDRGLVIFPQLMTNDLSRLRSPWQGLVQHNKQKDTLPPDLNISFQPPGSPARSSSGIQIESRQPDLALQL